MTDQLDENTPPESSAEAIWAKASDWLAERQISDKWTDSDQVALDTWLAESSSHLLAYWRVEAAWDRTNRLVALRAPMSRRVALGDGSVKPTIVKIAAAVVAISTLVGVSALYSSKPVQRTFATTTGGHQIVTLADGSCIELNTNTVLRLSSVGEGRSVTLERGEAYFQIRHDAEHPFVVIAGDHRVTDLGTKFVVRKDTGRLKISLLEGSARVDGIGPLAHSASATLTPGDVALATADTLAVTRKPQPQLANDLAWRRGLLVFNNTPLLDVVAELNRYNVTKLAVADPATAKIEIGGTFPASNMAAFLRVAHELLGLHVESHGNETVVSR